jgi:hypothetical protein
MQIEISSLCPEVLDDEMMIENEAENEIENGKRTETLMTREIEGIATMDIATIETGTKEIEREIVTAIPTITIVIEIARGRGREIRTSKMSTRSGSAQGRNEGNPLQPNDCKGVHLIKCSMQKKKEEEFREYTYIR